MKAEKIVEIIQRKLGKIRCDDIAAEIVAALEKPAEGAEQIAREIANEANQCCNRSDGYEENIARLVAQALTRHAAASEARVRELEAALRQMVEAIEKKAVSIDSACIGGGHPEIGYEQHYWHEEWLHYARRALGGSK